MVLFFVIDEESQLEVNGGSISKPLVDELLSSKQSEVTTDKIHSILANLKFEI